MLLLTELFQYRFQAGDGLIGHSFGNLFLTAMTAITGKDFEKAIAELNGRTVFNSNYTTNKNKHNQYTGLKCLRDSEFKEKCTVYSDELKTMQNDRKKLIVIVNDQVDYFIQNYDNIWKKSFIFSSVRNPLTRFESGFNYHPFCQNKIPSDIFFIFKKDN